MHGQCWAARLLKMQADSKCCEKFQKAKSLPIASFKYFLLRYIALSRIGPLYCFSDFLWQPSRGIVFNKEIPHESSIELIMIRNNSSLRNRLMWGQSYFYLLYYL